MAYKSGSPILNNIDELAAINDMSVHCTFNTSSFFALGLCQNTGIVEFPVDIQKVKGQFACWFAIFDTVFTHSAIHETLFIDVKVRVHQQFRSEKRFFDTKKISDRQHSLCGKDKFESTYYYLCIPYAIMSGARTPGTSSTSSTFEPHRV